jgi:hypothetical protein
MNGPEEHSVSVGELAGYRLWNLVLKARFFDRESRGVELGAGEEESAWAAFCERHKVNPASALPVPDDYAGCTPVGLREAASRELRIARWKETEFGPQVEAYFERQKSQLEKVVYSLLRVREAGVARELWLRIHEGEATFSGLAAAHGGGTEKLTGGIIGPVPLGSMHAVLATHLMSSREGELLKPIKIGEWHLVARLEKRIPAVLDGPIRAAILDELAAKRMEEHVRRG